jgi:cytochrome c oxidase assembly factor CtaG
LTLARVFTAWRWEPEVSALVVATGAGYWYALRVRRRRLPGVPWPRSRGWCFGVGLLTVLLVGCSFLGVYDNTLFWDRAVQNVTLLMVSPLLLALGAPISLLRDLLPPPRRARLGTLMRGTTARVLTFPLVVTVALVLPLLVLYLSPLYELTLRSPLASGISGLVVLGVGFLYFWTRFRIDPTPRTDPHGITLAITVVEMIGDAVLGVVLWLGPLVAAGYYTALGRHWGPSIQVDQWLGAGVLWVGGDIVGLPFIAVVFNRMVREDRDNAARIDAELDAEQATEAALPDHSAGSDQPKLWWEDHPELSERFRRQ